MSVWWRERRPGGALLIAFLGAWLSHTAIFVHLRGSAGLEAELLASPHRYMLPAAALILAAGSIAARHLWRHWRDLGARLAAARTALDAVWRGHRPSPPAPPRSLEVPSHHARALSLLAAVAPLQLTLYVLQENLEALSAHGAAPGLSVLWSARWTATVIHLAMAAVLCAAAAWLTRGVARRARSVAAHERLLRRLVRAVAAARTALNALLEPPLDRHGVQLWSRPPPGTVCR